MLSDNVVNRIQQKLVLLMAGSVAGANETGKGHTTAATVATGVFWGSSWSSELGLLVYQN